MASPREEAAEKIAQFIRDNQICNPYGGDNEYSSDKKFRVILFSKPRNLDGDVRVYSPGFIMVGYRTRYNALPHEDKRVFTSVENAIKFLDLAFVKLDGEAALEIPVKAGK